MSNQKRTVNFVGIDSTTPHTGHKVLTKKRNNNTRYTDPAEELISANRISSGDEVDTISFHNEPKTQVIPIANRDKAFIELSKYIMTSIPNLLHNKYTLPAYETVIYHEPYANTYYFLRAYSKSHKQLTSLMLNYAKIIARHPNNILIQSCTRYSDSSLLLKEEYCDGKKLDCYIRSMRIKLDNMGNDLKSSYDYIEFKSHQVQMAKGICRQLLEYCHYLELVLQYSPHKNICPQTILFRRDGCVKMKMPGLITSEIVAANPSHFIENNIYCSPEFTENPIKRTQSDYANDIWAVGAVLYTIMTCNNHLYDYSYSYIDPYNIQNNQNNHNINSKELQKEAYEKFMHFVKNASWDEWIELFIEPELAFIAKQCLELNPTMRKTAAELSAFIYFTGHGFVTDNQKLTNRR